MSRVQLAINVADLDAAVAFYGRLFDTQPAKRRPGYANFSVAEPPLKLVLIEGMGAPGSLNHLGVEVDGPEVVAVAAARLAAEGMDTTIEDGVTCCYARQDKVWVDAPDGEPWEIYTVLADAGATDAPDDLGCDLDNRCCGLQESDARFALAEAGDGADDQARAEPCC